MLPCACVAEYSLTGIDTIPKLTVSEANARAAIARLFVKNGRNDRLMGSSCQNAGKRATFPHGAQRRGPPAVVFSMNRRPWD
jgi:hypothetical protein